MAKRSAGTHTLIAALIVVAATPLCAQRGRDPATGASTAITLPTSTPRTQQSITVSGTVLIEDGAAPPEPVSIRRTCNGSETRHETKTDAKGHFAFSIGGASGASVDASDSTTTTLKRANASGDPQEAMAGMRCEISAILPGYRSDVVALSGERMLHGAEVGAILLHRVASVDGTMISATSLAAPPEARKEYDRAREMFAAGKVAQAVEHAQRAVARDANYAAAWTLLGEARRALSQTTEAIDALKQALQADAKFMPPYLSLAELAAQAHDWQGSQEYTAKVIQLDAVDFPAAYYLNAAADYNLGQMEAAQKSARKAAELDREHREPRIQLLLANILMRNGDAPMAAEQLRLFLKLAPDAPDAPQAQRQLEALIQIGDRPASPRQDH